MKFNPKLKSVIVSFNKDTKEEDILLIKRFYRGKIAELISYCKGVEKLSYQLEEKLVCKKRLLLALNDTKQDAYISMEGGTVIMNTFNGVTFSPNIVGTIKHIPNKLECCTLCLITRTYWSMV